jgi:hypothetical protein
MRTASGIATGMRRCGVCRSEAGLAGRGCAVAARVRWVPHIAQDFGCATGGFPGPAIAAAVPCTVLTCPIPIALVPVGLRLVGHVVLSLRRRRLLILARGLRDIVRGRCGLVRGVLLGGALLVGVAIRVVVVRRHGGFRLEVRESSQSHYTGEVGQQHGDRWCA